MRMIKSHLTKEVTHEEPLSFWFLLGGCYYDGYERVGPVH